MMEIITDISNCIGGDEDYAKARIRRCSESGCKLVLDRLPNRVILKGERLVQDRKICDCIIFAIYEEAKGNLIVGIVELKSKTVDVDSVVKKLTNGSELALNILENCQKDLRNLKFYHVILSKGESSSKLKTLKRRKILFRGKRYNIIHKRCGESFWQIVRRFG